MNTIGERIIFLRDNLDMTQVKLADAIGITKMTMHKYEKNLCEPRGELIAKMADVLNTTTDFLLGRTNDSSPLVKDDNAENTNKKELDLIYNFRRLTSINQAKIEERIESLLEQQG